MPVTLELWLAHLFRSIVESIIYSIPYECSKVIERSVDEM